MDDEPHPERDDIFITSGARWAPPSTCGAARRFCRMAKAKPPVLEVPEAYQRRAAADLEIARRRRLINIPRQEPPA